MAAKATMLPPTLIAPDIREAVDEAVEKIGVAQAEAVRQGLRFGLGRYVQAVKLARGRTPSNIRALLKDFPPLEIPANRKQAYRIAIAQKYARH